MQQVVVPQFLDVEDKIIGPVSVRQFLEMMVGGILIVVCYQLLDFAAFVAAGLIIFCLSAVIAFARVNGQPFHMFLLNFVQTMRNPKLKVWHKQITLDKLKKDLAEPLAAPAIPSFRRPVKASKISEIALIVDTGGVCSGEN